MLRSFFPNPRLFFPAALIWTIFTMVVWHFHYLPGLVQWMFGWIVPMNIPVDAFPNLQVVLEQWLSVGRWIGIMPTEADPEPFFSPGKVWLYQYVLMAGYLFCVPWYFIGGNRRWFWWSVVGTVTIVEVVYFNVQIEAWLNDWYGDFYNLIQQAIGAPNTVSFDQYIGYIWTVAIVLVVNITILVLNVYLQQHYLFRWRRAMTFYYMSNWQTLRNVEGAAQRVQEDTELFSSYTESIGLNLIDAIMTLLVFLPILINLSANITELPWIGPVSGSLVWVALASAAFGTALLWLVGIRLPGLEFNNQRVEAAFRKELVFGEESAERAQPIPVRDFFRNVQRNYFRLYFNYLYFNVARYAYLQGSTFVPYIALGPSIVVGAITLGLFQQVLQAFSQVSNSFRFLVSSWTTIIKLISVYKRLHGFEKNIPRDAPLINDFNDPRFLETGLPAAPQPVVVQE